MQVQEPTAERIAVLERRAQLRRLTRAIIAGLILRENHGTGEPRSWREKASRTDGATTLRRHVVSSQSSASRSARSTALAEQSLRNPQRVIAADAEARRLVRDLITHNSRRVSACRGERAERVHDHGSIPFAPNLLAVLRTANRSYRVPGSTASAARHAGFRRVSAPGFFSLFPHACKSHSGLISATKSSATA